MYELVKTIHAAIGTESTWVFVLVIAVGFAGVFGFSGGALAYLVDRSYKNAILRDPAIPLVVETNIDQTKQLSVIVGRIPISEVKVWTTEYIFQKEAFEQHTLKIESFSNIATPIFQAHKIDGESQATFDLTNSFGGLLTFSEFPESGVGVFPGLLKYYCLRITFRDLRSRQKFVIYEVTGSIKNSPSFFGNLESTAMSGTGKKLFLQDIPKLLIDHQRQLFGAGLKEYEP